MASQLFLPSSFSPSFFHQSLAMQPHAKSKRAFFDADLDPATGGHQSHSSDASLDSPPHVWVQSPKAKRLKIDNTQPEQLPLTSLSIDPTSHQTQRRKASTDLQLHKAEEAQSLASTKTTEAEFPGAMASGEAGFPALADQKVPSHYRHRMGFSLPAPSEELPAPVPALENQTETAVTERKLGRGSLLEKEIDWSLLEPFLRSQPPLKLARLLPPPPLPSPNTQQLVLYQPRLQTLLGKPREEDINEEHQDAMVTKRLPSADGVVAMEM